jgi:hypothetical protein
LNVHRVSDVRQIEIHTAEPLVPDPSPFEVEIAIAKLKRYKSPGSNQILAELVQPEGEVLRSEIHKHINSMWNKEELPDQCKESLIVRIYKKGDNGDCYHGTSFLSTELKNLSYILHSRLSPYIDEIIGDHQCGFQHNRSATNQIFFSFIRYWRKNESTMRQYISYS